MTLSICPWLQSVFLPRRNPTVWLDLARSNGKQPDGVTMMPCECGRRLIWDATRSDTYAQTYLPLATNRSGAVADSSESRKQALYSHLQSTHTFVPVAVETTGAFGTESLQFLKHLGSRLCSQSGNPSAFQQLIQRLSVAVQRGNAMAVRGSLQCDPVSIDIEDY